MHDLAHEFTSRKISPWGGIKFFYQIYVKTGLRSFLEKLDLPFPGSNRGYNPVELIEGFLVSVVLGARRLEHSGMLRVDEVITEIFGWKKGMASASTFSRFFRKFTIDRNNEVFPKMMRYWFDQMKIKRMTIDIDSTVITRYGKQELAHKGYNPQKPGRASHHPLMAFCDELKMVINAWMRSGDSHASTDIEEFLNELFTIVNRSRIGLIRGDSGFYDGKLLSLLEGEKDKEEEVFYIIRAKMTARLQEAIMDLNDWYACEDIQSNACYHELYYQATGWEKARRIIVVRTPKEAKDIELLKAQGVLFEAEADWQRYDYKAYVTNTNYSAVSIHRLYNQRGDCENRIKELKYDYSIDGFSLKSFAAMEAAFRFIMIAYNLMSLLRQKIMTSKVASRLSTIRFQCIAIGSYLVKSARKKILKLSAEGKRRHFLEYFFNNLDKLQPPFDFSIA